MATVVVNRRMSRFDVDITRRGHWGNPFIIGPDGDRDTVIAKHAEWIVRQRHLMARLSEIQGKRLGCVCKPLACHGDTLAALADLL